MKTWIKIVLLTFLLISLTGQAQDQSPVGFEDADQNGVNDHFADADGDGVNDVNGQAYAHAFQFRDSNGDGKNDLWADADGDGVNDLLHQFGKDAWVDMDGDGIQDEGSGMLNGKALRQHVLDMNQDGKNDVTGDKITGSSLGGFKYGRVDEESGILDRGYVDADGDGRNDRSANGTSVGQQGRAMDVFIDRDGDGIADGRGLSRSGKKSRGKSGQ